MLAEEELERLDAAERLVFADWQPLRVDPRDLVVRPQSLRGSVEFTQRLQSLTTRAEAANGDSKDAPIFISITDDDDDCHTSTASSDSDRLELNRWLLQLLAKLSAGPRVDETGGGSSEIQMERVARLLAELSGRAASSGVDRQWQLHWPDNNGIIQLLISEPSFVSADLGYKTWGGAVVACKLLLNGWLKPTGRVMELGCGTGLLSLAVSAAAAAATTAAKQITDAVERIVMTDYNEAVLQAAAANVQRNQADYCCVHHLDWFDYCLPDNHIDASATKSRQFSYSAGGSDKCLLNRCSRNDNDNGMGAFVETILAADVVYNQDHAMAIPRVVDRYLTTTDTTGSFHCILPLRPQYLNEVELLMTEMQACGFRVVSQAELWAKDVDADSATAADAADPEDRMCRQGVWYRWLHYKRSGQLE